MNITYYNIAVIVLVILLVWVPWLWRYKIKPMSAKKALNDLLKKHPEAKELIQTERFLNELYKGINSKKMSQRERKRLGIDDDAFVYGEIEFLPFFIMLDRARPIPGEIFYDLGSGAGKAVFSAASFFDFKKARGIELLPGLYQMAHAQIEKARSLKSLDPKKIASVDFINDNFLNFDFSDGDIVFINATCLGYPAWDNILKKLIQLKIGSRVIVTTKKLQLDQFKVIYQGFDLMSWGMNSVNIYTKIS